jgi:hypothetical protein
LTRCSQVEQRQRLQHAGVVDELIDAAELRDDIAHHLLDLVGIADVDGIGARTRVLAACFGGAGGVGGVVLGDDDVRTLLRQPCGDAQADALAGAGDDADLALVAIRDEGHQRPPISAGRTERFSAAER